MRPDEMDVAFKKKFSYAMISLVCDVTHEEKLFCSKYGCFYLRSI